MFWDPLFDHLSAIIGAPTDQLKLIFSFLISYALGSIFARLPASRPTIAHLFSIIISTFFLVPLLGLWTGLLHILFSCVGTYSIVTGFRGKNMPWIAFIFVMGHLLINHIRRYMLGTPVTTIEITGTQMVLAMKLTTFAWNVHDGRCKPEDLDASQFATRLMHIPSPLPFLGYCFFFPAMLVGPSFDYTTYDSLIHHTIYNIPPPGTDDTQAKATRRRIPHGRKRVAYLHLVLGLVFMGIYSTFGARAGYDRILTPKWYTWGWVSKFGFIQMAGFMARTKYYGAWSLTEGACILTGIGFNGYDPKTGRTLWNRVRNLDILSIETAQSFKVVFDSWNCRTNVWLRDCVYKRLVRKGQKPGFAQSMAAFVTSAFWHGVDPGYYLVFITAGLLTSLGHQLRHFVRPYFLPSSPSSPSTPASPNSRLRHLNPKLLKRSYDIIGWFMVQINVNYIACAFILLTFKDCMEAWRRMGWYCHLIILASMGFFQLGGRRRLQKGLQGKQKKKNVSPPEVKVSPPSPSTSIRGETGIGTETPRDEKDSTDLNWVRHALDNPSHQDGGVGVTPDAGWVDEVVKGVETPSGD